MIPSSTSIVIVDTDVFSYLWRNAPEADPYKQHLLGVIPALTFVTIGELYKGAFGDHWGDRWLASLDANIRDYLPIPLDESVARMWARIQTSIPSCKFPENDAWIAACTLVYGCPLLSHDRRDFHDIPGIQLITYAPQHS